MDETLYKLMRWPEIEAIVYSEHVHDWRLGGHCERHRGRPEASRRGGRPGGGRPRQPAVLIWDDEKAMIPTSRARAAKGRTRPGISKRAKRKDEKCER